LTTPYGGKNSLLHKMLRLTGKKWAGATADRNSAKKTQSVAGSRSILTKWERITRFGTSTQ
jgi:hypothetical protein